MPDDPTSLNRFDKSTGQPPPAIFRPGTDAPTTAVPLPSTAPPRPPAQPHADYRQQAARHFQEPPHSAPELPPQAAAYPASAPQNHPAQDDAAQGYPAAGYPPQGYPAAGYPPQGRWAYPAPAGGYGYDPQLSDKSKVTAGLLQIFLGGFGVGRFYLGYTGIGIAQIAAVWLSCGIGSIWTLIDGIMMLTGSVPDAQGRRLRD